jgi:peptide chain release factor 3
MFAVVELKDPLRSKQLTKGLMELGEEGAIQVFRPATGGDMMLGAVGQLQFEVVQHRLKTEYGVDVRLSPAKYTGARWVSAAKPAELKKFMDHNAMRMVKDAANTDAFLITSRFDLEVTQKRWPDITFHLMREHAGLQLESA